MEEKNIFTNGKISKIYMKLSFPLVLSMVVSLIYNLADTFFVAQTNNTDIVTGVSLCTPLFTLLMAVGNIFGQGGSSLISRYLGEKRHEDVARVSAYCFYVTIFVGVAIGAVMLLIREPAVWLLGADRNSFSHASDYYTWLAIGAPALILSFIHSNLLRSEGLSRESMTGTILGSVVNIILLLTGFSFGGQPLYGYYYGARDKKRLRELLKFNMTFIIVLAVALSAVVFIAAPQMMRIFMDNDQIVADGTVMLRWQLVTMVLVGAILLLTIVFPSFGKALGSFILSISRQGLIFLVVLMIMRSVLGYTGIIVSQAISDGMTAVVAVVLFMILLRKDFQEDSEV